MRIRSHRFKGDSRCKPWVLPSGLSDRTRPSSSSHTSAHDQSDGFAELSVTQRRLRSARQCPLICCFGASSFLWPLHHRLIKRPSAYQYVSADMPRPSCTSPRSMTFENNAVIRSVVSRVFLTESLANPLSTTDSARTLVVKVIRKITRLRRMEVRNEGLKTSVFGG